MNEQTDPDVLMQAAITSTRRPGPIDRLSALPARTAREKPEESCD